MTDQKDRAAKEGARKGIAVVTGGASGIGLATVEDLEAIPANQMLPTGSAAQ